MNRPIYKTCSDGVAERGVASVIERAWKVTAVKLPAAEQIDYLLRRGEEEKAYMEVKCRSHDYGTYETYTISSAKWVTMLATGKVFSLPVFLVVSFNGLIYWVDTMKLSGIKLTKGGRFDRGDAKDAEWMAHIPIAAFKRLTP